MVTTGRKDESPRVGSQKFDGCSDGWESIRGYG